jgi:arginase
VAIAAGAPGGYGITLDLDVIDPRDAPGVGTPAPGGMSAHELIEALAPVAADARLRALEIAEYNPRRDRNGLTAAHAVAFAETILGAGSDQLVERIARVA